MTHTELLIENLTQLGKAISTDAELKQLSAQAHLRNPWQTEGFVQQSLQAIASDMLQPGALRQWLEHYTLHPVPKTLGLITAGNVPLVGFHDLLCAYVSGCKVQLKLSGKDDALLPRIITLLCTIDSAWQEKISIADKLQNFNAVIATGSDNTHRYFEYYFRQYPKILRKNRNSVAVLSGEETQAQLEALADDVFMYFGLGCRNVSKLFVPVGFAMERLFEAFTAYGWLHSHTKYMNNYDYQRTILLLNKTPHLANEFVMLKESEQTASPIATLHYEYWHDENVLKTRLKTEAPGIQCVVTDMPLEGLGLPLVSFGQAQHPQLWDYADGVDTLEFLLHL